MGPTTVAIRSPFQTHTMSGNLGRSGPSVAILITCFYLANRRFPVSVLWIRWLYLCALTGVVCFIIVFVIHFFHVITCFLRVVLIVRGFNWEFREKKLFIINFTSVDLEYSWWTMLTLWRQHMNVCKGKCQEQMKRQGQGWLGLEKKCGTSKEGTYDTRLQPAWN